jgi:hypothetical protein
MKWKTYPMGGAAAEKMALRGLTAHLDHAVNIEMWKPLCSVKLHSLCMDDSLATDIVPDCPSCAAAIARAEKKEKKDAKA